MTNRSLLLSWLFGGVLLAWQPAAPGQPAGAVAPSAEDERERQIAERFVALLERNPRRGTALDRVYGYHVERGTLDRFLKTYRDRVEKEPKDGAAWLILGLFESQRGRDAAAVAALRQAETHRPADPLPCYYLGQALVLVGQPEAAAEAFERAIARKPARVDLLEVYQALGRSYQRTRRNEKALAVWARLEAQFPDDLRVKEQIADALAEESQLAEALPRYEGLARAVKDKYRQVQFQMEAAEIKVRLGKADDALADFEGLLGQLNPESWLYREVRRKIEEVFLRNDDLAGLASYYERWIKKTPDDVEALARLGRTLANQGRSAEARGWLEKAVKIAPSRRELRLALIDQLVQEGKFGDAAKQYEALSQADPRNLDVIREWGRLILKDETRPLAERRESVSAVWRRLTEGGSPDPLVVAQVADLFRQAEMRDEAIALYKKAIALAPEATQYREYLGEYYHTLKRRDEALRVWGEIAAGPRKDAKNLARLGEVLAGFGYRAEAVAVFAEACRLDDDELDLRLKYADALLQLERFDDALVQLGAAETLAGDDDQREAVLQRQIRAFQGSNTLAAKADALRKELDAGTGATAPRWLRLARYFEADQKLPEAALAVRRAMELEPKSVPSRVAAARIFEMAGDLSAASAALRELTVLDRRARSEYLANLAKLEARLGRREAALQAGRDLLAAAPGNVDSYQTFADLCFQLGEVDEGLDALRRSVRANPSDPKVATALAEALAQQFRTDEAIELYWRAYEKTAALDDKLGTVARLTELHLQQNHFDRLVARLERMQHEPDKLREGSLCLAQAYSSAGDLGTARQELERLLTSNTRDTQLLGQLSTLSEAEGDLVAAVKFQRQLVDVAPSDEATGRLAQLHLQAGDTAEAQAAWERLAGGGRDNTRTLQAIDSLMGAGRRDAVLSLTDRLIRKKPDDWDALVREGIALSGLGRSDEAARRFRAILAIQGQDDEPSALAKARARATSSAPTGAAPAASRARTVPLQVRSAAIYQLRALVGLDPRSSYYAYGGPGYSWSPADFGQARMVALAWLFSEAQKAKAADAFLDERRAAREAAPRDPRPAWDWYYLQLARNDFGEAYEAAKTLAARFPNDPTALWAYLSSLGSRLAGSASTGVVRTSPTAPDTTPPLPAAEVDRVVAAFDALHQRRPDWVQGTVLSGTMAELKRAGRKADEDRVYRVAVEGINDATTLGTVMQVAAQRGDVDGMLRLLDTLERLHRSRSAGPVGSYNGPAYMLMRIFDVAATTKNHAAIPRLLDRYLLAQRRVRQEGRKPRSATALLQANRSQYVLSTGAGSLRVAQVDYPHANAYLEQETLNLLRSAFEVYTRDDLVSDLVGAYRERRDRAASDAERLEANLVLWALDWWADSPEAAAEDLGRAVALSKGDAELSLAMAELHERRQEPDEALEIIDTIEALDNTVLQRRELAALRLAVATGRTDRARLACDRLFGLRLDTDAQTMLAGQMHQLGMHDQAEAVLARARRRAGQRTAALVSLMGEYQRQDKLDKAVQVAHQILRRGSGRQLLPPGYYNADEQAREQAVRLLARSGKLNETIERLEAQAERSPNALTIQQTLADYYRASNDREKLRATYEKMVKLKPDDARLRFQVAGQLAQAGDAASALEHFRVAITREPALLANNQLSVVQSTFMQAKKTEEFAQLLESIDLRTTADPYAVSEATEVLLRDPKTKDRGRKLFQKLWEAHPEQRSSLIQNHVYDDAWWSQPDAYDLARQAMIPTVAQARLDPWYGIANTGRMYTGDGRVVGLLSRVLAVAAQQGKTADLAAAVEAALKDRPGWMSGKAILAILRARDGKIDEARADLKPLLTGDAEPASVQARWMIAQELEGIAPLQDLVLALYESELKVQASSGNSPARGTTPLSRMIAIHQRAGRLDEARALVRKMASSKPDYANYPPEYAAAQRARDVGSTAAQLLDLGATVDAIRTYGEMMALAAAIPPGSNYYPSRETASNEARAGLDRALQSVRADSLGPLLESMLEPPADAKPGRPALDLVLLVQPPALDQATVFSLLETLLAAPAGHAEARAKAVAKLDALAARAPDDLAVGVARTLVALGGGDAEAVDRATKQLAALVRRTPLDELPRGARANARQREQAATQLGLWLVARACWKVDSVREQGDVFAARALEAARRQTDAHWALAMYREWGQLAFDRGDRAAAEKRWTAMLDLILSTTRDPRPAARPGRTNPTPAPAAPRTAPAPAPEPKAQIKKVSQLTKAQLVPAAPSGSTTTFTHEVATRQAATSERFEQATQVAMLAAERGMTALSLRAVREALRAGPPTAPMAASATSSRMIVNRPETSPAGAVAVVVETQLGTLVASWRRHGIAAADLYEVLRDCVLPAERPGEMYLYPRPLVNNRVAQAFAPAPRSVGTLLVQAAVEARRVDELRRAIEGRRQKPTAEPSATVLLAQLAMASGDAAAAVKVLGELDARLARDTLQNTAELACHAALPALEDPALAAPAAAVLERAVRNLSGLAAEEPAWSLERLLARHWFAHGAPDKAVRAMEDALAATDRDLSRYSGGGNLDYVMSRRRQSYVKVAAEYAASGQVAGALDLLGRYCDAPTGRVSYGNDTASLSATLVRHLSALPAAERYERLRAWTMPTPTRASTRLIASFVTFEGPPAPYPSPKVSPSCESGVASTAGLLFEAAKEVGKLDELADELRRAADRKVEGAEPLYLLAELARGQGNKVVPRLTALADEVHASLPDPNELALRTTGRYSPGGRQVQWTDYLIAAACVADPALSDLGERMANDLIAVSAVRYQGQQFTPRLRADLAARRRARARGAASPAGQATGLAHWATGGELVGYPRSMTPKREPWVAHEDHAATETGEYSVLTFALPLTGTFEFSVDALINETTAPMLAYGGAQVTVGAKGQGYGYSTFDPSVRSSPLYTRFIKPDAFNRLGVAVEPGRVRFLLNGHLYHEQAGVSPAQPWLSLAGMPDAVFRNPTITGDPRVPRRLVLTDAGGLGGWTSSFYNEVSGDASAPAKPSLIALPRASTAPREVDWSIGDGVITGRRTGVTWPRALAQSRLELARALRDGETLSYRFYHVPDSVSVHPALGRLAFLLEPDGVRLHWMTPGQGADDWTGITPQNAIDDPGHRRGPARLPLKPDDWNAVTVKLDGGAVRLTLNDVLVYERPLGAAASRRFSFYHDKDRTEARIRSVVLEGAWPEKPPGGPGTLFALAGPADEATRRGNHAVIGEAILVQDAGVVAERARHRPAAERYDTLAAWVLPRPDHPTFRLQGEFRPVDPPAPAGNGSSKDAPAVDRGGGVEAPALDLVAVAKELGKLDEVERRITSTTPSSDLDRRGQLALKVLIQSARGREAEAHSALDEMRPLLAKLAADAPEWQRWPELVALSALARTPVPDPALTLLDALADVPVKPGAPLPRWLRHARHLRAVAHDGRAEPPRTAAGWSPVSRGRAETRGQGDPPAVWTVRDGQWTRTPADGEDSLDFACPLRPPFEVEAELASSPTCQTQIEYGGVRLGLDPKGAALQLANAGRKLNDVPLPDRREGAGPWHAFRLVIGDRSLAVSVDGRKVHEQPLAEGVPPWLSIRGATGMAAMARRVRINGTPAIPRDLRLTQSPGLEGWSSGYYNEPASAVNSAWERRGDEIAAPALKPASSGQFASFNRLDPASAPNPADLYAQPGSACESVLQYQRPLARGDELAYEFYYDPGKVAVHPALDRLAFLLEPDGVKVHVMTDAQYGRSGLAPDNVALEPETRRGPKALPLRPGEWNRVKVSLDGDRVAIALNDVAVAERRLDGGNSRIFGLFRYADRTEVRVRNVTLRGRWPASLAEASAP